MVLFAIWINGLLWLQKWLILKSFSIVMLQDTFPYQIQLRKEITFLIVIASFNVEFVD